MDSIGNDIVDLKRTGPELHPRFIARVFSASEQALVTGNPRTLWLHWAAKEAAYKTVKRLDSTTTFAHSQFEFDSSNNCVRYRDYTLPCHHVITDDYAYVVCASSEEILRSGELKNWVDQIQVESQEEPPSSSAQDRWNHSEAVRSLAINKIAAVLHLSPQKLHVSGTSISKNSPTHDPVWSSIPCLSIAGQPTDHLLSLSHDGRFILCSHFRKDA